MVHCPDYMGVTLADYQGSWVLKGLFENNLFNWNWKLFVENTVDKGKS